jgi:hypothetical protein
MVSTDKKPLVTCEFCKRGFDPVTDRGSYSHDWAVYKCRQCEDLDNSSDAYRDAAQPVRPAHG